MNNKYYTYAYLRKDRTPYYIGKGKSNRAYKKRKNEIQPPKDENRIIFLKQNLTEEEAFKHEIYMIAVFGRKDLGTGILHNRTDGGDGASGIKHSEETKKRMSNSMRGKLKGNMSENTKKKLSEINKGKRHTEETRRKIGEKSKGRKHTEESKKKLSIANKGNQNFKGKKHTKETISKISTAKEKQYKITFIDGRVEIVRGMDKWCKNNPQYSIVTLNRKAMGKSTKYPYKDIAHICKIE